MTEKPEPADEPRSSAYDSIKDVVGSLEGPGDMSHNPAYLDDLGESSIQWGEKWRDLTPQERIQDLQDWMASIKDGPGLPLEATRRDAMYD